ncbi:MAG: hypothetical protein J6R47_04650 [Acholeplasmatales bacterium]|nr:hypothetical protein [Acholeplasmatales bacterium]
MIQLQFLNKLLDTKDTSTLQINNIDPSFFSDFYKEYSYIKDHLSKFGNIPDKITFANEFPDFDFIEVHESPNYLLDKLYEDKNTRTLANIFNKVRDLVNDGKIQEATSLYLHAGEKLNHATHIQATNIITNTSRYESYIERTQDYGKYRISTGFPELDEAIGGWDRLEELATIVARPGVGKSFLTLKFAAAAAKNGLTVGIYSGEMTELKVGYRLDSLLGGISNKGLMRGNIDIQNSYKVHIDNLRNFVKGDIWVTTPYLIGRTPTVSDLGAFIDRYKIDILFVDQHSLLEDERKAKDSITKAANISTDLKKLQTMKQIPIIAVSQQNRSAVEENGLIDVSHIAQSDKIGQDSTTVIAIEKKENVMTLHLAKCRDSITGAKLKYAVDLDKGVFSFIPNEEDALNGNKCEELRDEYEYVYEGSDTF